MLNNFVEATNTVTMSSVDHADNQSTFGQVLAHGRITRPRDVTEDVPPEAPQEAEWLRQLSGDFEECAASPQSPALQPH